jgi:hypothetical protein
MRAARKRQFLFVEVVDMKLSSLRLFRESTVRHADRTFAVHALSLILLAGMLPIGIAAQTDTGKREQYIQAVVRGEGYMPWQEHGLSREEIDFRNRIEQRKTRLLAERGAVRHPVMLDAEARDRARRNMQSAAWARDLIQAARQTADYLVTQPEGYAESMIGELTPWYEYGMTCPNCVGVKSQEGVGHGLLRWDYREPDKLTCGFCGHVYPSPQYPETQRLVCPRSGQIFTFFLNPEEQAHPDNRTGELAYHWVGHPMHMSFSGTIRQNKANFMIKGVSDLALTWFITDDPRYARRAQQILLRLARCYRGWLYHDYWNTVADADPLYAASHDTDLELVWKRHLATGAFEGDSLHKASMKRDFWGAGRLHPSTDGMGTLYSVSLGFDLVADARDSQGQTLWSAADREKVERDLLLEWIFTGEPYVGGPDQARLTNNKSPRIYHAFASVARALNLPRLADTALRGYEGVRDASFTDDGYSNESPGYTMMYLSELLPIPERLYGFDWPDSFPGRRAAGDLYRGDPKLRLMYRMMIDQLQSNGMLLPIEDTGIGGRAPGEGIEMGLKRYPEYFRGKTGTLLGQALPGMYALFHLEAGDIIQADDLSLPEIYFPGWMTAVLRHGPGRQAAVLSLNFSPEGNHRHADNLSLFYNDRGQTLLGDHGYVGDMPVNEWIVSTFSHNLVIVDGQAQRFRDRVNARHPRLEMMFTSPRASAVEASSDAYGQCSDYRRLVILLKGPEARTVAVDIFRVRGGRHHDYRLFSEIASSDAGADGALKFQGIALPPEPPLPEFGGSIQREAIFGLRDSRENVRPPASWQAVWNEPGRSFRFWCLSPVAKVTAANGPGQENHQHYGRRVRTLDLINDGEGLSSAFVGLHEPGAPDGLTSVRSVRRIDVPAGAGPSAVALAIDTAWGSYIILNEFAGEAEIEGVRFQGKLGIFGRDSQGRPWLIACGASTLRGDRVGFSRQAPEWAGRASGKTAYALTVSRRPPGWADPPKGCQAWVLLNDGGFDTGFPVSATQADAIAVERFPIPAGATGDFRLRALRYLEPD